MWVHSFVSQSVSSHNHSRSSKLVFINLCVGPWPKDSKMNKFGKDPDHVLVTKKVPIIFKCLTLEVVCVFRVLSSLMFYGPVKN